MKTDTVNIEKWYAHSQSGEYFIAPESGKKAIALIYESEEAKTNAELILSAVNACKEINPDNPIAVAKAIPQLFEVLKEVYNKFSAFGFNWEGRNTTEGQFLLSQMHSLITDITE